jgi:hypothetical protein
MFLFLKSEEKEDHGCEGPGCNKCGRFTDNLGLKMEMATDKVNDTISDLPNGAKISVILTVLTKLLVKEPPHTQKKRIASLVEVLEFMGM